MTSLNLASSHASRIFHVVQSGLQPAGIEPHVTRSWHRCLREYGIEPSSARQNAVLDFAVRGNLFDAVGRPLATVGVVNINASEQGRIGS